jgi:putative membrane protein
MGLAFFFLGILMNFFEGFNLFKVGSTFFLICFCMPSYYTLGRWLGIRRSFFLLLIISLTPVLVEGISVKTGLPYGVFSYSDKLGWKILDTVPWTLILSYPPILLGSISLTSQLSKSKSRFKLSILGSIINTIVDLVIDPAAVFIGFWAWDKIGIYYGVPLINFYGWLFTSFLYINIFYLFIDGLKEDFGLVPLSVSISLLWIVFFWVGYLFGNKLFIPGIIGLIILSVIIYLICSSSDHF